MDKGSTLKASFLLCPVIPGESEEQLPAFLNDLNIKKSSSFMSYLTASLCLVGYMCTAPSFRKIQPSDFLQTYLKVANIFFDRATKNTVSSAWGEVLKMGSRPRNLWSNACEEAMSRTCRRGSMQIYQKVAASAGLPGAGPDHGQGGGGGGGGGGGT
jgi:hypothetical protein